jgi:hypothetical protein
MKVCTICQETKIKKKSQKVNGKKVINMFDEKFFEIKETPRTKKDIYGLDEMGSLDINKYFRLCK